jgi:oligopeptide transport system substrate-binding protein
LANPKIRQALSLAIDRTELVDLAFNGRYDPSYGDYPHGMLIGDTEARSVIPEPLKPLYESYKGKDDEIRALFQEGLDELGYTGSVEEIKLQLLDNSSLETQKVLQEYLKQTWENAFGLKIELNVAADQGLFVTDLTSGNFDIVFGGMSPDYNDPMNYAALWISSSTFAQFYAGYGSEKYDGIFEGLRGLQDNAERAKIYGELEKLLITEDFAVAPLYFTKSGYFVQSNVKGLHLLSYGPKYDFSRAEIIAQ